MYRSFEKARWKKEDTTIKPNQFDMPSVHQRAAFFCARHGHMRRGKHKR